MKNPFSIGDIKKIYTEVTDQKLAEFDTEQVHPIYSTFALVKDAEWACRQFLLEMTESGEEGIGSYISVNHISPAVLGSKIMVEARLVSVIGNKIDCYYEVFSLKNDGDHETKRLIAYGSQVQKIINKSKFDEVLAEQKKSLA